MQRFLGQFEAYYFNNGKCRMWDTEECKKKWQYGPWGQDLFMQFCRDDAAVAKREVFTLTNSETCPGMRPNAEKGTRNLCLLVQTPVFPNFYLSIL